MRKDIKQQENGDVELKGDISYVESTDQHKADILKASKGDYSVNPLLGVNAIDYLLDENPKEFVREVARQTTADGMTIKNVSIEKGDLIIEGEYED